MTTLIFNKKNFYSKPFGKIIKIPVFVHSDIPIHVPAFDEDPTPQKLIIVNEIEYYTDPYMQTMLICCVDKDWTVSSCNIIPKELYKSRAVDIAFEVNSKKKLPYGCDIIPEEDVVIFFFCRDKKHELHSNLDFQVELVSVTEEKIEIKFGI
jgi:hypothetical protein